MYKVEWDRLVAARETITHYAPAQAVKVMKHIAKEKYFAMEHHYPSRMEWINKFSYDPKQLHHLLRVEEYIERYINGEPYEDCLQPRNPEYLKDVKRGYHNLEEARELANKADKHIDEMCNEFLNTCEATTDTSVDELLDDVQYNITKIAIKKEICD
jgi:hypothetical protein